MIEINDEMKNIKEEKLNYFRKKMDKLILEAVKEKRTNECIYFNNEMDYDIKDEIFKEYRDNGYKIQKGDGTYHNQLCWFISW